MPQFPSGHFPISAHHVHLMRHPVIVPGGAIAESMRRRLAWVALGLLSLGGALSMYFLAFSVWMTAYPYADLITWRTRFYQRLAITLLIGALWIATVWWLLRHRIRTERRKPGEP